MFINGKVKAEQQNLRQHSLDYEKMMAEQKERIFALIDENNKLKELNDVYKTREEKINSALVLAVEKAEEYETASKMRYDAEIKRIKIFSQKWISYFNKIKELLPEDKKLISAEKLIKDMDTVVFNSDYNLKKEQLVIKEKNNEMEKHYKQEKERIEEISKDELYKKYLEGYNENAATFDLIELAETKPKLDAKQFAEIIEKVRKAAEGSEKNNKHAINLEEVLNPQNLPELEVLCNELGIS